MKADWRTAKLGEICTFNYGKALPEKSRNGGTIPVFGSNGVVGYHDSSITSGCTIVIGRKGSFGEINYSEVASWPIDTAYFVDEASTEQDIRWLFHMLGSIGLNQMNKAAAVPGLNREDAYRKEIRLPPLPEQRRIAAILDKADALRTQRREALAQLDRLAQAIFVEMFGDPVTNPKGWPLVEVGSISDVQGGLQVTTARKNLPLEVPYLRVANVYRGRLELGEVKTIRATESELARTKLNPQDVLIVEGHGNPEEVGRAAMWSGEISGCVHQNHLIRVRFDTDRVLPSYACDYLNSPGGRQHLLRAGKTTSGLNTISVSNVRAVPVALPTLDAQKSYEARISESNRLKATYNQYRVEAENLFASLQHRAFRGEL